MARSSDPDSASSQFFIVQSDSTFLDGDYAAFGHVTEGMDVVDKICKDAAPTDDNGTIESEKQPGDREYHDQGLTGDLTGIRLNGDRKYRYRSGITGVFIRMVCRRFC